MYISSISKYVLQKFAIVVALIKLNFVDYTDF